jgi:Site-specific recombinase XerD
VAVALYEALPPNDRARIILSNGFVEAGIDRFKYKRRGPKPKQITKLPPSAVAPSTPSPKVSEVRATNYNTASFDTTKGKKEPASFKRPLQAPADPPASISALSKSARKETASKNRTADLAHDLDSKLLGYKKWLNRQPLSSHSKRAYLSRIVSFIAFLKETNEQYPALSPATKDLPVRDLRQHLKKKAKLKPASVNSYLAAIDNFYGYLDLGKIKISRDDLPQEAPVALEPKEQDRFLRTIEHTRRVKDKAIATLLLYTGMRVSECTQLELDDVFVVGRKTKAIIRAGKGDKYREVPLNSAVCQAIREWLVERKHKYAGRAISKALFLNPQGKPLSSNSVYGIIRKLGEDCGLELSPHTLRHTCFTKLIRNKNDLILVSDIAGHRSLNTTKRYALPSAADKAKALEDLID